MLGVSSRSTSTPVTFSKVLMLRPSLPIILPLTSSSGSLMVETVYSATYSVAALCIASTRTSLAFLSAFSLASSSFSLMSLAISSVSCFSTASMMSFLDSSLVRPAARSSFLICFLLISSMPSSLVWSSF